MKHILSKSTALALILLLSAHSLSAQSTLTLKECRQRALENNKSLHIANEKVAEADALQAAALCQFFPKVSANGTYLWMEKSIQLLSDEQQDRINNMGTTAQDNVLDHIADWMEENLHFTPEQIASLRSHIGTSTAASDINALGHEITAAANIDVNNIFAAGITVTQPIYMGGKLRSLYQAAHLSRDLCQTQYEKAIDEQLVAVDAAYWQVITVQHKQQLAQQYYNLLQKLLQDVEAMEEVEVATHSDVTRVRVKLNEAQMSLSKANNGLALSRMLLNQMCGLPLYEVYELVEDTSLVSYHSLEKIDMQSVLQERKEMKMLDISRSMANVGIKAATSALLPNIGFQGGYMLSNPNLYNGLQKDYGGMFVAGVVVNVPICHPSAFYSVKAAKHKRNIVNLEIEEARDKIEMQVNKLNFELQVANDKLNQATANLSFAEENLKLAEESFAAGMASAGDLMQAQTAWLSARNDVEEARVEIRMSHIYLRKAMGLDLY